MDRLEKMIIEYNRETKLFYITTKKRVFNSFSLDLVIKEVRKQLNRMKGGR